MTPPPPGQYPAVEGHAVSQSGAVQAPEMDWSSIGSDTAGSSPIPVPVPLDAGGEPRWSSSRVASIAKRAASGPVPLVLMLLGLAIVKSGPDATRAVGFVLMGVGALSLKVTGSVDRDRRLRKRFHLR